MKRAALVLALLTALTVASGSSSNASTVVGERAVAVSEWLSCHIVRFLGVRAFGETDLERIVSGGDAILGGDADDYANGKGGSLGPDTQEKRDKGLASTGGVQPLGSSARTARSAMQ